MFYFIDSVNDGVLSARSVWSQLANSSSIMITSFSLVEQNSFFFLNLFQMFSSQRLVFLFTFFFLLITLRLECQIDVSWRCRESKPANRTHFVDFIFKLESFIFSLNLFSIFHIIIHSRVTNDFGLVSDFWVKFCACVYWKFQLIEAHFIYQFWKSSANLHVLDKEANFESICIAIIIMNYFFYFFWNDSESLRFALEQFALACFLIIGPFFATLAILNNETKWFFSPSD